MTREFLNHRLPGRKLVVFDVDGTLVDSREILKHASAAAFKAMGLPPRSYDALRQTIGLGLEDGLAQLAPEVTPAERAQLCVLYKKIFTELHLDPDFIEPLYAGAAALLDRLKREGWLIAMATGKGRRGVELIMAMHGWADLFDSTHCSDDGPGKPHPAMLLAAMQALDVQPHQTIMVGDTGHDMRMAIAAGVRAQGVSWGFHTRKEVQAAGADHVADTFAELDVQLDLFGAGLGEGGGAP